MVYERIFDKVWLCTKNMILFVVCLSDKKSFFINQYSFFVSTGLNIVVASLVFSYTFKVDIIGQLPYVHILIDSLIFFLL